MRRRALKIASATVVLVAIALGVAVARDRDTDAPNCRKLAFNPDAWQSEKSAGGAISPRQQHAGDLVNCHFFLGRSLAEIREMLGPPDESDGEELEYLVGPERGPIQIDGEYLYLAFSDGIVRQAELVVP